MLAGSSSIGGIFYGLDGAPERECVVVQFADGTSEEHVLRSGEHFADAWSYADVPLSINAGDFTRRGQLRYFALNLRRPGALSRIVLESYDTDVVPATTR